MLPKADQRPVHVAPYRHTAVVEPVHLLQIEPAAVEQAGHHAAAGSAEVDGQEDLGGIGHAFEQEETEETEQADWQSRHLMNRRKQGKQRVKRCDAYSLLPLLTSFLSVLCFLYYL